MLNLTRLSNPLFLVFAVLVAITGCADDVPQSTAEPFADCRYGPPKPIFSDGLRSVNQHDFRLEESRAVESLSFDDGLQLLILQTGCDYIHQEFRFGLVDQYAGAPASYWIQESINMFYRMGQLGPPYVAYSSIADALNERSSQLTLGKSMELQPGFFAKIESGSQRSGGELVVVLSEQPTGSVASK